MASSKKVIGVFTLAMINVALICSIRGLPMMAEYGPSIVFFLLVAVLLFLIPVSLASAELATGWPKQGGIYTWVKEAFGEKWGFITIFLQWLQNLVFYPTALAATAAVIAYLFNPALAANKLFNMAVIIIVYWGAILINLRGMKISGKISSIGSILGIILPGAILVILALGWILSGEHSQVSFALANFAPDLSKISNIVFLTGMFLFFAGIEVSGVHANEVHNPQKDYPKAILISAIIVTAIFLLGSLSIAIILPKDQISLTAGIMQTFKIVFDKFNLAWAIPVIVVLAAPGMIVQVSSWIAGPSRGLLATAKDGSLPPLFQKINQNDMPINIMLIQGIIVTLLAFVFLFAPSVNNSFWILTDLAAILYLSVYIIMFLTVLKLRYSQPTTPRPFKIPWGQFGLWFFVLIGIFACLAAIILGLFPPAQLQTMKIFYYDATLILGTIIIFLIPFIIHSFRRPKWKKEIDIS